VEFIKVCRQVLKNSKKQVKTVLFQYISLILGLGVPPNFLHQINVPRAQKG